MTEREYVYEFGLTPDDKERLHKTLGVYTLSLEDYGNAMSVIESLDNGFSIDESDDNA